MSGKTMKIKQYMAINNVLHSTQDSKYSEPKKQRVTLKWHHLCQASHTVYSQSIILSYVNYQNDMLTDSYRCMWTSSGPYINHFHLLKIKQS